MKTMVSRRQFIAQLAAAPISCAIGNELSGFACNSNDGFTGVCVFAWSDGRSPARALDLWMARCGSIDVSRLSDVPGRCVVWDDITSERTTKRSVEAIKSAISHFFDFPVDEDKPNSAIHLGEIEGVPKTLGNALALVRSKQTLPAERERTAIVDLSSCGVTQLQWRDLIPSLKQAYGTVVGVDFTDPHFSDADPAYYDAPYQTSQESWRTLMECDFWAIASDASLSYQPNLCFEARSALFTEALNGLVREIALASDPGLGFLQGAQKNFLGYGSRL